MQDVQDIFDDEGIFVQIFDANQVDRTKFFTPATANFQVGVALNKDAKLYVPHIHTAIERSIIGTAEFIFVLEGRMRVTFLDGEAQAVGEASLTAQMGFVQTRGGHAIETDEGTKFIEVKQGPYMGYDADKYAVQLDQP